MEGPGCAAPRPCRRRCGGEGLGAHLYHNMTLERAVLKVWNESGTNRGRIGDSSPVQFRSRDIWRQWREAIPDRGLCPLFDLRFRPRSVNDIRDHDSAASQERSPCGLWGCGEAKRPKADRRRAKPGALIASWHWRWSAADTAPTRIASPATRRARSASAARNGTAPRSAYPRSAPSTPRRRAAP